jgi:Flp pilus assembly protein TadD
MTQAKWDDVEYRARQALRIEENAEAYNLLGIALDILERPGEASAAYTRGIELEPEWEELYCNFGQLVRKSDLAKADALFCKAIELRPDFAEAHRELGILLLRQKVLDESEYHLRRAIELDPADPWAHLYLGKSAGDQT